MVRIHISVCFVRFSVARRVDISYSQLPLFDFMLSFDAPLVLSRKFLCSES